MFEGCDPGALLIEVESSRLDESAVWAHRMAAIAALLTRRMNEGYDQQALLPDGDPGFGLISGFVR
ncbi:HNH endonuclease, partial [Mycolicibacterium murale]|nr:HNH endonuclease [Mycolicibacterium murale]